MSNAQIQEPVPMIPPPQQERMGIWQASILEGQRYYIRDKKRFDEWKHWADINKIGPKQSKRVVLFGESVARGYLFDPYFNPARVMQQLMDQFAGETVEIIDLAKISQGMWELRDIGVDSLSLEADAIVIFAGNNWLPDLYGAISEEDMNDVYRLLEEGRPDIVKQKVETCFSRTVHEFFNILHRYYPSGMNIIFVIPEYNLADWDADYKGADTMIKPAATLAQWEKSSKDANEALKNNDKITAGLAAEELIRLDPCHPLGYRIKAAVQEDPALKKKYLEMSRDTSIVFRSIGKPRILSIIRESILSAAKKRNIQTIDLATYFWEYTAGKLPDRRLFLDYCHLTVEGIQITAGEICRKLLSLLCDRELPITSLQDAALKIKPAASVAAMGHVFAAIHNAHQGQSADILQHHCLTAVDLDPRVSPFMHAYMEMATYKAPSILCRAFEKILKTPGAEQYEDGLSHEDNCKIMDAELVGAMLSALEHKGTGNTTDVIRLRRKEHSINVQGRINLLLSFYSRNSYKQWLSGKDTYLKERERVSRFYLVADQGTSVDLQMTGRTGSHLSGPLSISVNQVHIATVNIGCSWTNVTVCIPGEVIKDDINLIELEWPLLPSRQNMSKRPAPLNISECFNPVIGEIHRMQATCQGDIRIKTPG